jgi:hypothetical protein
MTQSNVSNPTSGPEHSAFRSAQFALARKPWPGPPWAGPGVAALAVAGVAYLVASTTGGHAAPRAAAAPSAEIAGLDGSNPAASATAPEPTPPVAAPSSPATPPAAAPTNDLAAAPAGAAAAPANAAEPAKPSDAEPAVASASAVTKKKARGAAHRSNRKRSTRAH